MIAGHIHILLGSAESDTHRAQDFDSNYYNTEKTIANQQHRTTGQFGLGMVAHQAVSQYPAARKVLIHPHESMKCLFLRWSEHEIPPHHAGDAVVDRGSFGGVLPWGKPACASHNVLCLYGLYWLKQIPGSRPITPTLATAKRSRHRPCLKI
jgi:hypothetical protein